MKLRIGRLNLELRWGPPRKPQIRACLVHRINAQDLSTPLYGDSFEVYFDEKRRLVVHGEGGAFFLDQVFDRMDRGVHRVDIDLVSDTDPPDWATHE